MFYLPLIFSSNSANFDLIVDALTFSMLNDNKNSYIVLIIINKSAPSNALISNEQFFLIFSFLAMFNN